MYNNIREYIIASSLEGEIVFCNEHFLNRFEYKKEEIVGSTIYKIINNKEDKFKISNELNKNKKYIKFLSKSGEIVVVKAIISEENFNKEKYIFLTCKEIYSYNASIPKNVKEKLCKKYNGMIKEVDYKYGYNSPMTLELSEKLNLIAEHILDYTYADGLFIFLYDENLEMLKCELKLKEQAKFLNNIDFIPLKKEDILLNKYREKLNKTYKRDELSRMLKVYNNEMDDLSSLSIYSIESSNEFLGIICLNFNNGNLTIYKNHEYMKYISSKIAVEIKNSILLNQVSIENEKRKYTENELESYLNVSVDLVATVSKGGYLKKISPNWPDVLGWSEEELFSMFIEDIVHPDDMKDLKIKSIKPEDIAGKITRNIIRFRHKEGHYIYLEWNSMYRLEDQSYITTSRDITNRIKIERNNKKLKEAVELEIIKNEMFSNVSHEFRTPINIILGTMQVIDSNIEKNNLEIESLKNYTKYIKQNSYRLLKLVNNLIDVSKMDIGAYGIRRANKNIVNVIEEITLSVADYMKNNNINLIFDTDNEEIITYCDADKIERIMLNLLSNAIKYTPDNGSIIVNINSTDKEVIVSVKDSGVGIPKDKLDIVFDRFRQVNSSYNRQHEGSGIGLSLVKKLVEMHDGSISVNSEVGKGAEFIFTIPIMVSNIDYHNNMCEDRKNRHVERCNIEFSDIYN